MEQRFKKITIALMALGLTGAAAAASYSPAPAPVSESSYHIGGQVLYLSPHSDSINMRYATRANTAATIDIYEHFIADTDFDWAFRIEAGFHDGDGNDFTVQWLHHDNDDEISQVSFTGANDTLTPRGDTTDYEIVKVHPDFEFDRAGLEYGHTFDPHNNFTFRLHSGLEYLRVDHAMWIHAYNTNNSEWYTLDEQSDFEGFGIRTGADMSWNFMDDFNLFGRAAVGLTYGDIENHAHIYDHNNTPNQKVYVEDHDTIVADFSAVAGVDWTKDNWTIEGGWRHDVVVHANRFADSTQLIPASNYSQGGPFLGIIWRS